MATNTQYDFFKFIHSKESERYSELINRGKIFLTIITLYIGALVFKSSEFQNAISENIQSVYSLIYFSSIGMFLFALILNILALGIYTYEKISNPEKIIKNYKGSVPKDSDFLDDRIADLTVSFKRNSKQNDKRAKLLFWVTVFMLLLWSFRPITIHCSVSR